ncbi:MAG: putative aspartyl protease [Myxococcota bacterium]|jgi:predicted aspartyl protease
MAIRVATNFLLIAMLLLGSQLAGAELTPVAEAIKSAGYISVPITRDKSGGLQVEGRINGETLQLRIDLGNDEALFDIRRLKTMALELEKTEVVIPTKRKNIRIYTTRIAGLEFESKSTGAITIHAGDIDALYNVRPGHEGPDGVLGMAFLTRHNGLLDLANMKLHLKLR